MSTLTRKGGPGSGHFSHRGRPGLRGGSAPGVEQFLLDSGLLSSWDPHSAEVVAMAFTPAPVGHFDELSTITPDEAEGIPWATTYRGEEEWHQGDPWPLPGRGEIYDVGVYDPVEKSIHLNPKLLEGAVFVEHERHALRPTALHELGHHVIEVRLPQQISKLQGLSNPARWLWVQENLDPVADDVIARAGASPSEMAERFGLKASSIGLHNAFDELVSDAYLVYLLGNLEQQANLKSVMLPYGVDLDELFQP